MNKRLLITTAALLGSFSQAKADGLTAYPYTWDVTAAGSALPASAMSGTLAFDDEFKTLSIGADGAKGVKWYAPILPQLGMGTLAQPTDRKAISLSTNCLTLQTRNPAAPGNVDVNIQTMDAHGNGFSMANGYFEAAISLPAAHGSHTGFWFDSVQNAQGHSEIDFPETYGAADHVFASVVHWWPTAASRFANHVAVGNYWRPNPSAYAEWHRYGVLLTPAQICTYMDRKEIGCIGRLPEANGPMFIQLSVITDTNRTDGYEPAMMRVAYVRAWTP